VLPAVCRLLGRALVLRVDSATSQAAAVQSAWQLHKCHIIVTNSLSSKALPAVQAALAAGVSVVAAVDGFADLAALHSNYAAVSAASSSDSSSSGATEGADLWELLSQLSGDDSRQRCCVVECVPGYR
jgi:ABC-type sugar transport system substrate-binding protein